MAELEAHKRDNIPDTTQEVWFREFKRRDWNKIKFDAQFQKVLNNPSFGAVKIDEFFNEETTYSSEEVAKMTETRINNMIRQGEKILQDKEIDHEQYLNLNDDYIKLAVTHKLKFNQYNDKQEAYEKIIDKAVEFVKKEFFKENNAINSNSHK